MPKKIEPTMGIPASEFLLRLAADTSVDAGTVRDSRGRVNCSDEEMRLQYDGRGPEAVQAQIMKIMDMINPDACMNEDQVIWVKERLLAGKEQNPLDDAVVWAPAINAFRLECRDCLRANCDKRDLNAPLPGPLQREKQKL